MKLSDLTPGQLFTMAYRSGLIERDPLNTIYKFDKRGEHFECFYFKRLTDPDEDVAYGLAIDVDVWPTADQSPQSQTPQP